MSNANGRGSVSSDEVTDKNCAVASSLDNLHLIVRSLKHSCATVLTAATHNQSATKSINETSACVVFLHVILIPFLFCSVFYSVAKSSFK